MKPMTTPSAKTEAIVAIGRSAISVSTWSSCSLRVSPSSFKAILDLVGESVGAALGGVEHSVVTIVQEARYLVLERLQLITQVRLN